MSDKVLEDAAPLLIDGSEIGLDFEYVVHPIHRLPQPISTSMHPKPSNKKKNEPNSFEKVAKITPYTDLLRDQAGVKPLFDMYTYILTRLELLLEGRHRLVEDSIQTQLDDLVDLNDVFLRLKTWATDCQGEAGLRLVTKDLLIGDEAVRNALQNYSEALETLEATDLLAMFRASDNQAQSDIGVYPLLAALEAQQKRPKDFQHVCFRYSPLALVILTEYSVERSQRRR